MFVPLTSPGKLDFNSLLTGSTLVFDGAMGTMLQQSGVGTGLSSEEFNTHFPEVVAGVHQAYLDAGADVLTLNTFGVSKRMGSEACYPFTEIINGAAQAARHARDNFESTDKTALLAYDMGPTGILMHPAGTLSFDQAYDLFATQARLAEAAGCDLILIETITDISEARAALLAAKENSQLPVAVTLSFQKDGRTLNGTDPETMAHILGALGADLIGINCSLGPEEILPLAQILTRVSPVPVMIQANAGMPFIKDGITCFPSVPDQFAEDMGKILASGVAVVGGCCGTSPDHIRQLKAALGAYRLLPRPTPRPVACSPVKTLYLDETLTVVGERLNPSGNKKLKAALKEHNRDEALKQAMEQERLGAQILDLNTAIPGMNERELLTALSSEIASLVETPLQFDSSNYQLFEDALRKYPGKALINSASAKQEIMDAVFPVAAKYGALVVCLLLDENGLPQSFEERMAMADRMVENAKRYGIHPQNLAVDCLTLTVAAQEEQAVHTLKAIEAVKARHGCLTTLGVSNISYGLPCRPVMNRAFLSAALERGLDLPIIDPYDQDMMDTVRCFRVLKGYDPGAANYIERFKPSEGDQKAVQAVKSTDSAPLQSKEQQQQELFEAVLSGYKDTAAHQATTLLTDLEPLQVINQVIVPALQEVGDRFEKGKAFLPQLIRSAEAAGRVFDVIRDLYPESEGKARDKVILATVQGDIHDIGKNLVKILLKNHGFNVIDLGKDVAPEAVLKAVSDENCKVVGLSALMTTTLPSMEATIRLLREHHEDITIFVGGAVLTEDYALEIKASNYCKDALASVHLCQRIYG